jgi:DNA/RNA-binding domain of Phe-tRNA-synthetase-like protein
MQNIHFSKQILQNCPHIRLSCILAKVKVESSPTTLWDEIETELSEIQERLSKEEIKEIKTVAAARAAYKQLGKDPSRYRPSAEALLRRVLSGKSLYKVNNLVDLINRMSVRTGFSIGGYNYDAIQGQIEMSVGLADDDYQAIGRGTLNIEYLPCLRDKIGAFGSPTSDSQRTSIQNDSLNCLWVYFDFGSDPILEQSLEQSADLLKRFASAEQIQTQIIHP